MNEDKRTRGMTEIVVPALGESVTEATVAKWLKQPGETVAVDEPVVELETDKVSLEVNATAAGTLSEIRVDEGATVEVGAVLGVIGDGAAAQAKPAAKPKAEEPAPQPPRAPAAAKPAAAAKQQSTSEPDLAEADTPLSPAVRKLIAENRLDASRIPASGKNGRLTKEDVLKFLQEGGRADETSATPAKLAAAATAKPATPVPVRHPPAPGARDERRPRPP